VLESIEDSYDEEDYGDYGSEDLNETDAHKMMGLRDDIVRQVWAISAQTSLGTDIVLVC
jgi:hypothetical protein